MLHRKSKKDTFEREASERRFRDSLREQYVVMTRIRELLPYLLEDDRIAADYIPKDATESKLLVGGYYRYYDPSTDFIHISPFQKPTELGLVTILGSRRVKQLRWRPGSIVRIYIPKEVDQRIITTIAKKRASNPPRSQSTVSLPTR